MFSPVDGEQRLVGVAFAYQATPGQPTPDLFDGEMDSWHAHPELSPPGQELTMLHVWFVRSPDGPFAGHNSWLPYWSVGLQTPDVGRLTDPADSYRIRALALALSETVDDAEWEQIRAANLESIRLPAVRERLTSFYEEMLTGGHGAHAHE